MKKDARRFIAASLIAAIVIVLTFSFANFTPVEGTSSCIVSGYVFDPANNPVANAYIYLINSDGFANAAAHSDGRGFYFFTTPLGTYRIVGVGPSGTNLTYSEADFVINGDIAKNLTLIGGFKVSGYVLDPAGRAVAGAVTTISSSNWLVPGVATDSSGKYAVYIPAGTYTFIIWPLTDSKLINFVQQIAISGDLDYNITLSEGYTVSGYITYPSGEPAAGLSTRLASSNGTSYSSGLRSNASGYYSITVPAGLYTLSASLSVIESPVYLETNIVVNADVVKNLILLAVSPSPTYAFLNVGQSLPMNALAAGGSGTYSVYTWYVNGTNVATQSVSAYMFAPVSVGTYSISVSVADSAGAVTLSSPSAIITVNSALTAPEVIASKSSLDQCQTALLIPSAFSTGTAPYTYQWYVKAPNSTSYQPIENANTANCLFATSELTAVGVWSFVLNVTDSATTPVTVSSNPVAVEVNSPPSVVVTPQTSTLDLGTSKTFTAEVTGGSGTFTYRWFLDGAAVENNNQTYLYTATSGHHTIYVTVTDSADPPMTATSDTVQITVNPALVAPTIIASKMVVEQGQSITLTSTEVINGTAPYLYQWLAKAPNGTFLPILGATSNSFVFETTTSTAVGSWSLMLNVTDSADTNVSVTPSIMLPVNAAPTVSIAPAIVALDVTHSQTFTATPHGGSGAYTGYQWYVDGSIQVSQTGSTFTWTCNNIGICQISVSVTDSFEVTSEQAFATVTVNPSLANPTLTNSPTLTSIGQTVTLSSTAINGTPEYTYTWYMMAPGDNTYSTIPEANSASYNFVASTGTALGDWLFKVQVTDASGEAANSTSITFPVNPKLTVTITPTSASLNVGQLQTFTASPNGGSGTYTSYQWYIDGATQSGQTASTFNFSPSNANTYQITVTVTDSTGKTSQKSATSSIQALATPTPTPSQTSTSTPTPSQTATPTSTQTPSSTSTTTATPTQTQTATPTPVQTQTTNPTQSVSLSATTNSQQPATNNDLYIILAVIAVAAIVAIVYMVSRKKK
jgi:hypothetical protein